MRKLLILLYCLISLPALAQEGMASPVQAELGIVAVVNDEVITNLDVADRIKFVVATTRLPNTKETMARLVPQVTRQLVDETLQLQEARRLGINITNSDIDRALNGIAGRQQKTKEEMVAHLLAQGVEKDTLDEQIKAQIAWQKIMRREVRPSVKVSDTEIERARLSDSLKLTAEGAIEVEIMSLVLPVRSPEEEAEVKALADKLVGDIREGTEFKDVAAQFGMATVAEPIWVPLSELEPGLATALKKAVPGTVSNPTRTLDGYVIIKLLGRRGIASAAVNDSLLLLKDILLMLKEDDEAAAAELSLMIAKELARNPGTCKSSDVAGVDGLEELDIRVQFVHAQFSELSPTVQQIVSNLSVGAVSEPFASPEGIRVFMLCERIDEPPALAAVEATYAQLMNKKMGLEGQKYMRNLRRDAFIELRR